MFDSFSIQCVHEKRLEKAISKNPHKLIFIGCNLCASTIYQNKRRSMGT